MLRQNAGSNKRGLGLSRFSTSNFFTISNSANWGMGRSTKSNSLSSVSSNSDSYDNPIVDSDYIMQLSNDVRKFAEVLTSLKETFHSEDNQHSLHHVVHERLGELLRVLKAVISKHHTLNSVDILSAAGTVIAKVKGINFKEVNDSNRRDIYSDIFSAIDALAFTFGNVVTDFLMGDVDNSSSLTLPLTRRSRSFENISVESGGSIHERDDVQSREYLRAEEVDNMLLRNDCGIDAALAYAKAWSKYTKDILAWLEKRLSLEVECAKNFAKMAESAKSIAGQQVHMPFQSIYVSAFDNDMDYSQLVQQTATALQSNRFVQPLLGRRNELDRLRKELKDNWQRGQRKMQDSEAAVKKAQLLYAQRQDEYKKAKQSTLRAEEENLGSGGIKDVSKLIEKRRRLEEEALQKAEEAREQCKVCVADAAEKRNDLENIKSETLMQLRELVYQCDLTLKAVTVNLFQMQQTQVVSLPVNFQSLCENAKLYEPGEQYSEFVKSLPQEIGSVETISLETQVSQNAGLSLGKRKINSHSSHGNLSQGSGTSSDFPSHSTEDVGSPVQYRSDQEQYKRSSSTTDSQALKAPLPFRSSSLGGMCSDSESIGGSSESRSMDSPSASPGDFKRRLPRTPSTGTMSSADDLDEREPPFPSDNGLNSDIACSPGPFRNALMSKAAQTHRLRKLRAPSKCRECDSLVVFHGAECEECSLACHKKCLETLAIQCGHKKLHGRLHLFGVDFAQAAKNAPDGIPFIIKKCTTEIESRALNVKGIYRVNGAKSRVEKLCQAFENGKDLVELSDLYAHDISNVLKLYLRQLPEPLILFRFYNEFIGLAKESHQVTDESEVKPSSPTARWRLSLCAELSRTICKVRDLLRLLPQANYNTLRYIIGHLHRVTECQEDNKMSAGNLGIIFGPTLIRPRQTDATVSLSSLVDYPYQARMVEILITYYDKIFDGLWNPQSPSAVDLSSEAIHFSSSPSEAQKEPDCNRNLQPCTDKKASVLTEGENKSPEMNKSFEALNEEENPTRNSEDKGVKAGVSVKEGLDKIADFMFTHPEGISKSVSSPAISLQVSKVHMRPPRLKPTVRPVSLPVDRIVSPCILNEKNTRNEEYPVSNSSVKSPTIEEVSENKTSPSATNLNRYSYFETSITRRPWDRQYKCYDMTPKTAMIMANVPQEIRAHDTLRSPDTGGPSGLPHSYYTIGSTSANTTYTNKPYSIPVRTLRTSSEGTSASESSAMFGLRGPRTLQPPPGTFYRPPNRAKETEDSSSKTAVSTKSVLAQSDNEADESTNSAHGPSVTGQLTNEQKVSVEEVQQAETKPVYQRLRPKRVQELEQREAHFV
ncbi:rho GTPase-activating protein 29 [Protopterus annectens]|uniref:rho GTPase-activating protein 29 n=1 Tax=Protopterus annectens TaxID=7888 RepID=UPI001CFA4AAD|nr:rho GTPase-activating protein 29 [Protopterus annectens]